MSHKALIDRLRQLADKRQCHDIGEYWNACEEAADALEKIDEGQSRSQLRRIAAQRGNTAPDFSPAFLQRIANACKAGGAHDLAAQVEAMRPSDAALYWAIKGPDGKIDTGTKADSEDGAWYSLWWDQGLMETSAKEQGYSAVQITVTITERGEKA